jgi:hypothetical protein
MFRTYNLCRVFIRIVAALKDGMDSVCLLAAGD